MPKPSTGAYVYLPLAATVAVMAAAGIAACHRPSPVARVLPGVSSGLFSELPESYLATLVVCHDTLGRPLGARRTVDVSRCTPCIPYAMQASDERSIGHARRLWQQGARAPYDTFDLGAGCTRLAYRFARSLRPNDDSLAVEATLVELANARDSSRGRALHEIDSLVQHRITNGRHDVAARMLAQLASGMWDRAQRQLERPAEIPVDDVEEQAHDLRRGAPSLRRLPPIPQTSRALGVSEALWATQLFDAAARLTVEPELRSHRMRLALAPWVVLEAWAALDSAASALLRYAPNDSSLLPARALSAYRRITQPAIESPRVMALFDSVLRVLPRSDSARYDTFDGLLTASDDDWRYGFLPDQRLTLDERGWTVLDPLWSTPVHEIRLARRARMAEADYRYADIARRGESGSETRPGQILLRRGAPTAKWIITDGEDYRYRLERSWRGLLAKSEIELTSDASRNYTWRVFYGARFTPLHASTFTPSSGCERPELFPSLFACAIALRSDWSDVPFYGQTDQIDVTVARFRAGRDSADMYIGARVPLRGFKSRDDDVATCTDRIALGVWLTTEQGVPVFHQSATRELPTANLLNWKHQWTRRVGSLRMMHRVEALEPTRPFGARGAARFTSDGQVAFPLRGFGMSDILIAESATPRQGVARKWSDLVIQPNGATVAPKARFAMAWEVYDLAAGPDGRVRWRVRIKRERGEVVLRADMKDVLAGSSSAGSRVLASESSAPDLSYVRDAGSGRVVLENIVFGLGDVSVGHHVINVTVDDLVSGKTVSRGVSVRVLDPASQKRGTPIGSPFTPIPSDAAAAGPRRSVRDGGLLHRY